MTSNRIQKLLFSEYSDFEDIVLVESPFAETSKYGRGVRQIQMGKSKKKKKKIHFFCAKMLDISPVRTTLVKQTVKIIEHPDHR